MNLKTHKKSSILLVATAFFTVFLLTTWTLTHAQSNGTAFDLDDPPKARIELTPEFSVGARTKIKYKREDNFNLDLADGEDLDTTEPSLSFAFNYTPNEYFTFFVNFGTSVTLVNDEENKKENVKSFSFDQFFLTFNRLIEGMSLKVGRQRIEDEREWIFDENLDAVRLFYAFSQFALDLSVGESFHSDLVNETSRDDDRIVNYILHGKYSLNHDNEAGAYVFYREDENSEQEDLLFFGARLIGEAVHDFQYWIDFAYVTGTVGPNDVRGYGWDVGFVNEFDFPFKPALTLGYAFGSGDGDPSDSTDKNFRQTGLQDNNAKFNGVTSLKYYGELVDPELSNLHIFTAGVGIRPIRNLSIDFVYHYYRQDKLASRIRDSEIEDKPDGLHEELGQEIDMVLGYKNKPHIKFSVILGYFIPGKAFPTNADNALYTEFNLQYDF